MFLFSMHWVRKVVSFMDMKIAQNFLKGIDEALPLPSFLGVLFLLFSQLAERTKKRGYTVGPSANSWEKKERNLCMRMRICMNDARGDTDLQIICLCTCGKQQNTISFCTPGWTRLNYLNKNHYN